MSSFKRRKRFHERLFQSLILSASLILSPCANLRVFAEPSYNLSDYEVTLSPIEQNKMIYSGSQLRPNPTVMDNEGSAVSDDGWTVEYGPNINAGTSAGSLMVKPPEGATLSPVLTGSKSITFDISKLDLTTRNPTITLSPSSYTYTGEPIEPNFDINYTSDEMDPETGDPLSKKVNPTTHEVPSDDLNTPTISAKKNYAVNYSSGNHTDVGTVPFTVTFADDGNYSYTGDPTADDYPLKGTFTITPATLTSENVSLKNDSYKYTGNQIKPAAEDIIVKFGDNTLIPDTDFIISYPEDTTSNIKGTGSFTITGKGNYQTAQPIPVSFKITEEISETNVTLDKESYEYTGSQIKPEVTVTHGDKTLVENTDYTLLYGSNIDVSTGGTVTITGIGTYEGSSITKSFEIIPVNISSDKTNVSLEGPYEYTGKKVEPTINITYDSKKLTNGTDYSVTYSDNIEVSRDENGSLISKATAHITGKGNYTGKIDKKFTITPASVTLTNLKASDIVYGQELSNSEITGKATTSDGKEVKGTFSFLNGSTRTSDVMEEPSYDTLYEDYVTFTSNDGNYLQLSNEKVPVKIKYWGTVNVSNGKRFFVDSVGKTSAVIKDTDDIIWLKEDSDNSFAWYGIKNPKKSDGTRLFKTGSRFSVRWFNPNDFRSDANSTSDEKFDADPDLKDLDSQLRDDFLAGRLWLFQIEVTDPDGNKYDNFYEKYGVEAPVYVQLGTDWENVEAIEGLFVAVGTDDNGIKARKINSSDIKEGCPIDSEFAKLTLKHFSVYGVGHNMTYDDLYSTDSGTFSKSSSSSTKSGSTGSLLSNYSSPYSYSSPYYTSSSCYKNDGDDYAMEMYLMSAFLPTVLLMIVYKKKRRLHEKV